MSDIIVVALPQAGDKVNKISSEKAAHLTVLYLGEQDLNLADVFGFVEHAASNMMPFSLNVSHRGELGDKGADVAFFEQEQRNLRQLTQLRFDLLNFGPIRTAYDTVEQFPKWIPHLTLGYPDAPAKPDTSDYPGLEYVHFDRIAVWVDDFEGPEFRLKYNDVDLDLAMSELDAEALAHFGVKGMKWGVRKESSGSSSDSSSSSRSSSSGSTESTPDEGGAGFNKKKAATILGSAFAVAAIAGGAYYISQNGGLKLSQAQSDSSTKNNGEKFAKAMAKEPVGIVHGSRGKHTGFVFLGRGGLDNPLGEYEAAGFDGQSRLDPVRYGKNLEKIAATISDPEGRRDWTGRPILHEIMLPADLASRVTDFSEKGITEVAWPLIKDQYEALWQASQEKQY